MRVRGAAGLGTGFGCSASRGLPTGGLAPGAALNRPHVAVSAEAGTRGLPGLGRTAGGAGRVRGAPGGPAVSVFLTGWLLLKD